jgi:tRNA (mo5U34)-methyltransferase
MRTLTIQDAETLASRTDFQWWQKFELAPGVMSPGVNEIEHLLERANLGLDLTGASVIDIGATNGAAAFICERRGADRVVAVDLFDTDPFGFTVLRDAFDSKAQYVQSSIYELPFRPEVAGEQFDVVLFLGVLYHLRHPLLALDSLRLLTRGHAYLETAVSDNELPYDLPGVSRFYRAGELNGDGSNWFSPNVACLLDWVRSAGFEATLTAALPTERPHRAQVTMTPTARPAEWLGMSYERPLAVHVDWDGVAPARING